MQEWHEQVGSAQPRPEAKQPQCWDELMGLVEVQATGPMTGCQLSIPQIPKKRRSSEALGGDAGRVKMANQAELKRSYEQQPDPKTGKRVEKRVRQRHHVLKGEYYCGSCAGMRRAYKQGTGSSCGSCGVSRTLFCMVEDSRLKNQ